MLLAYMVGDLVKIENDSVVNLIGSAEKLRDFLVWHLPAEVVRFTQPF